MGVVNTMNSKRATDEVRHANEDLEHFYMEAKRNKRLAKWAAELLKLEPKAYFMELVDSDLTYAGPKPVIDRIITDFKDGHIDISEEEVWQKLRECEQIVLRKMLIKAEENAVKNHQKKQDKKKTKKKKKK